MRRDDIPEIERVLDELYAGTALVPGDTIARHAEKRDVTDETKRFFREQLPRGVSYRRREVLQRVDAFVHQEALRGALR